MTKRMRHLPSILLTLLLLGALALGVGCSRSEPPSEPEGVEQASDRADEPPNASTPPPPLLPVLATYPDPEIMLPLPAVEQVTPSIAPYLAFLLSVAEQTASTEDLTGLGYALLAAELELDIARVETICSDLSAMLDRARNGQESGSLAIEIVSLEQDLVTFPSRQSVELVRELLSVDHELLDPVWRRSIADRYGLEEVSIGRLVDIPTNLDGQLLGEVILLIVSERSAVVLVQNQIPHSLIRPLQTHDYELAAREARAWMLRSLRKNAEALGVPSDLIEAIEGSQWRLATALLSEIEPSVLNDWRSAGLLESALDTTSIIASEFALRLAYGPDAVPVGITDDFRHALVSGFWIVDAYQHINAAFAGTTQPVMDTLRQLGYQGVSVDQMRAMTFAIGAPDDWAPIAALVEVGADELRRFATSVPWWDRGENLPVSFVPDRGDNRDSLKPRLQVERERILREIEAWRGTSRPPASGRKEN